MNQHQVTRTSEPLISVLMPAYNEPKAWFEQAIQSVLQQSYRQFELIIILDKPDNQMAIDLVQGYQQHDSRIQLLVNEENMGLPRSLNRGLAQAKGAFIARIDSDDQCLPARFAVQLAFLQQHPEIDLVGSAIQNIDQNDQLLGVKRFLTNPKAIEKAILYRSVACHPCWLFRREILEKVQGYRYFPAAEDYDFLMRVLDSGYRIANVPEPLVLYRIHSASMTSGLTKIQYDVKNYILLLHQQRMQKGSDDYSEQVCVAMKAKMNQSSPSWASVLVTKARAAEESKKMIPLVFWGALALLFSGAGISRLKSLLGYQYIKWRYEQ